MVNVALALLKPARAGAACAVRAALSVLALLSAGCPSPPSPPAASAPHGASLDATASGAQPIPTNSVFSASSADADTSPPPTDAPPLPPGVLAEAHGHQGLIRVEEADGLRLLTITAPDGARTVHAARPIAPGALVAADPIAALLRLNRPPAPDKPPPRALVIGLGSGQTAADIAALGYDVRAIELEPAVIDMARAWFAYRGHAEAADGLAFLSSDTSPPYQVILLDAFQGQAPPPALLTPAALALLQARLAPGGLLAVRLLTTPDDPAVGLLLGRAVPPDAPPSPPRRGDRFSMALGSGAGQEPQNILILRSDAPLSALIPPDLPLWLLSPPADLADHPADDPTRDPSAPAADAPIGTAGEVTLIAYLSRTADGLAALDLPHYHMGARRYLVRGDDPAAARLLALLPADADFPTAGDIGSDGDLGPTLSSLLGGGGVKRSEVRFSPVVVAVRGRATLRAVINPDHMAVQRPPSAASPRPPEVRAIPYGGVLYDLSVSEVLWGLDPSAYQRLRAQHLAPALKRARTALDAAKPDAADLAAASAALQEGLRAFTSALGPHSDHLRAVRELARLIPDPLPPVADPLAEPFAVAVGCDRAQHLRWSPYDYETFNPDASALGVALARCAMRAYLAVARDPKHPDAATAAARLLWLVDSLDLGADAKPAVSAGEVKKLLGRFPDPIEPLEEPPAPAAPTAPAPTAPSTP